MTPATIETLFGYSYWATGQILAAAQGVSDEVFQAPAEFSYRGLRGTLVHALDVERGWRLRIQGQPAEVYDAELPEEEFPDVASLARAWAEEETAMRAWLATLDDGILDATIDLGPRDRFPLATFLLHIVTHTAQQRRDAALILERAGCSPGEIDFLYYADSLNAT